LAIVQQLQEVACEMARIEKRSSRARPFAFASNLYKLNDGSEVRMIKLAFLTAAVLVVPAPAFAQIVFQDTPATATPKDVTKSDLDKLVCRRQETLGSRLQAKQVCLTKEQWFQQEQANKDKVRELQDLTPTRPSN
jgi:hypothetical protein